MADDFPADPSTNGSVTIGGVAAGVIDYMPGVEEPDVDWFRVALEADTTYAFSASEYPAYIEGIYNSSGVPADQVEVGYGGGSAAAVTSKVKGDYYVAVSSYVNTQMPYTFTALALYEHLPQELADLPDRQPELVHLLEGYTRREVRGYDVAEIFEGRSDDETLHGYDGADTLLGRDGDDIIFGDDHTPQDWYLVEIQQIYGLYNFLLGRNPGSTELERGVETIYPSSYGGGLNLVAEEIMTGSEFVDLWGEMSNAELIDFYYARLRGDVVDNDPGRIAWLNLLNDTNSYDRFIIAQSFVTSAEFENRNTLPATLFAAGEFESTWEDEVFSAYRGLLGRDPDVTGFSNWGARIDQGLDLVGLSERFIASAEFRNAHPVITDRAFAAQVLENLSLPSGTEVLDAAEAALANSLGRAEFAAGQLVMASDAGLTEWMRNERKDDVIVGGDGGDILFGGRGADRFVFTPFSPGRDTVGDLQPWDYIDLTAFNLESERDALDAFRQDGPGAVFELSETYVRFTATDLSIINGDMLVI